MQLPVTGTWYCRDNGLRNSVLLGVTLEGRTRPSRGSSGRLKFFAVVGGARDEEGRGAPACHEDEELSKRRF